MGLGFRFLLGLGFGGFGFRFLVWGFKRLGIIGSHVIGLGFWDSDSWFFVWFKGWGLGFRGFCLGC